MAATVWVVDDDSTVLDVMGAMLRQLGYKVELFEKGEIALQRYADGPPDLLVADLRMPGMTGLELTRAVLEKDPQAIVMILTGYPSIPDAVEAIRLGATDFISKPCTIGEIHVRIERALANRHLERRLKKTRQLMWMLVESLPAWIILGMVLARLLK
jgi:DNA-binding NtrC family response regulator